MTDHEEAACRLQEMLRFDTTNPPGNELALVTHLAANSCKNNIMEKYVGEI